MKTVYINIVQSTVHNKQKIVHTHLYYDAKEKKMQQLTGGRLQYTYDWRNKRCVAGVEDVFVSKQITRSNIGNIQKFLASTNIEIQMNEEESDSYFMAVDVDDIYLDDFIDEIQTANLQYHIK